MMQLTVSGNVGNAKTHPAGHFFFSVASSRKNKDGSRGETTWVNVNVFNGNPVSVAGIEKGVYVTVTGLLDVEMFNGKPQLKLNAKTIQVGFQGKPAPKQTSLPADDMGDILF